MKLGRGCIAHVYMQIKVIVVEVFTQWVLFDDQRSSPKSMRVFFNTMMNETNMMPVCQQ